VVTHIVEELNFWREYKMYSFENLNLLYLVWQKPLIFAKLINCPFPKEIKALNLFQTGRKSIWDQAYLLEMNLELIFCN